MAISTNLLDLDPDKVSCKTNIVYHVSKKFCTFIESDYPIKIGQGFLGIQYFDFTPRLWLSFYLHVQIWIQVLQLLAKSF